MKLKNNQIIVSKQEWMVNFLFTGLAIQFLEKATSQTQQWWTEELSNKANQQYDEIAETNPQQIEKVIKMYSDVSGN